MAEVKKHLPHTGWQTFDAIHNFNTSATCAGLCGDAKGRNDRMISGDFMSYKNVPVVAYYHTGAVIDFFLEINTKHNE